MLKQVRGVDHRTAGAVDEQRALLEFGEKMLIHHVVCGVLAIGCEWGVEGDDVGFGGNLREADKTVVI